MADRRRAQRVLALALTITATFGTAVAALREPLPAGVTPDPVITEGTAPGVASARLAPPRAPVVVGATVAAATPPTPKPAQRPIRAPRTTTRRVRSAAPARYCPALPAVSSAPAWAGYARDGAVSVHEGRNGRLLRTLANPTRNHQRLVLGVLRYDADWAFVRFSERPNGSVGWVRVSELDIYSVRYRLVVARCARRVTVFDGGRAVFSAPVAVGKASTPTPLVEAYVDYVYRWPNPNGTYGAVSLGVAAFSEVYERFGRGGVGQIAIHGTTSRSSVGRAASNGCVRMYNEDVRRLADFAAPGTPVSIVP